MQVDFSPWCQTEWRMAASCRRIGSAQGISGARQEGFWRGKGSLGLPSDSTIRFCFTLPERVRHPWHSQRLEKTRTNLSAHGTRLKKNQDTSPVSMLVLYKKIYARNVVAPAQDSTTAGYRA